MIKQMSVVVLLALALSALAVGYVGGNGSIVQSREEQEVRGIEAARAQAIRQGDAQALERIYADDFAGVTSGGRAVTKAVLLGVLKNVDPKIAFTTEDLKVRIFGETALASGRITGKTQAGETVSAFSYLHVYVRRAGHWQLVAGQSTDLPKQ